MSQPTQQISAGLLFHFFRSCLGDLSRPQVLARLDGRALSPRHSFFCFDFIPFLCSTKSSNRFRRIERLPYHDSRHHPYYERPIHPLHLR
mgnify:CR=1 FL=1